MSNINNNSVNFEILPRLTDTEFRILALLIKCDGEMRNMQIFNAARGTKVKSSSLYVILNRMVRKRLLARRPQPRPDPSIGADYIYYGATDRGRQVFKAYEVAVRTLAGATATV